MATPLADIKNAFATILKGGPDGVQQVMDNTAKATGKKLWRAALQVACSGFGKGLLATAAIVILASALTSGIGALAAAIPLGDGLAAGAVAGAKSLIFSGTGLLMLGVGGTLGAVMDVRAKQSQITAEVAQAEANIYETMRLQQQARERGSAKAKTESGDLPEMGFAAREMQRRNATQTQPMVGK